MSPLKSLALAGLIVAAAATAEAAPASEMKSIVDPASTLLFAVGGEVDPGNGPDAAKVPAARWQAAAEAAAKLEAVAGHLQQPAWTQGHAADWLDYAKAMAKQSATAAKAARAHDGATLAQAANDLGDTCSGCHGKYKPKT